MTTVWMDADCEEDGCDESDEDVVVVDDDDDDDDEDDDDVDRNAEDECISGKSHKDSLDEDKMVTLVARGLNIYKVAFRLVCKRVCVWSSDVFVCLPEDVLLALPLVALVVEVVEVWSGVVESRVVSEFRRASRGMW